jgi:hypothetical protein
MDMVQCLCTHLTSFAGDFFVMPNAIDWSKISLDNLFSNPTVFAVVMAIFGLYVIGMIWARKKDKQDLLLVRLDFMFFMFCEIKLTLFIYLFIYTVWHD